LTRDVEVRTFSNGGKVAQFGFAVTGSRKKNQQTGKWEDEPCFLDVKVFNRGETGRSADLAEQYLSKGKQVFLEGHLRMESWTAQDGQKRNKIVVEVDNFQFLEPREGGSGGARSSSGGYQSAPVVEESEPPPTFAPDPENKEEIPF
jgi:single-strand DNA-binding protein